MLSVAATLSYNFFSSLTHCILLDSSTVIYWTSTFVILVMLGLFCRFYSALFLWKILLANNVDPDHTHITWSLFWVCTICLCPFYGFQVRIG